MVILWFAVSMAIRVLGLNHLLSSLSMVAISRTCLLLCAGLWLTQGISNGSVFGLTVCKLSVDPLQDMWVNRSQDMRHCHMPRLAMSYYQLSYG